MADQRRNVEDMQGISIPELIAQLNDPDVMVREAASVALVRLGDAAIEPLVQAMNTETLRQCWVAAGALAKINDVRCVQPMIEALQLAHPLVRQMAAVGLGRYQDQRAVLPLIAHLEEPSGMAQIAVINALGQLGDGRALTPLVNLLKITKSATVRYTIIQALGTLGERNDAALIALIRGFEADPDHHVRERAAAALAKLGGAGG